MKVSLTVAFFLLAWNATAQEKYVHHFDEQERFTEDTTRSFYFIEYKDDVRSGMAYYTATKKPRFIEKSTNQMDVQSRTYYYVTGEVMAKGNFSNNAPRGELKISYPDGKPLAELFFSYENENRILKVNEYWDQSGNKLVENGNGTLKFEVPLLVDYIGNHDEGLVVKSLKEGLWKGTTTNGSYVENYKNGVIIDATYTKDGNTSHYTKVEHSAAPKGGLESFYKFVGGQMHYPAYARRKKIQGKVFVEFIVNKDGTLSDGKVVRGIHPLCDEEALKAVMSSPAWNPGLQRGLPVRQRMVLPITFKLG